MEKTIVVRKVIKKINQEKILILLVPIALIFIPIIVFLRPFFVFRFGLIHSDRIGHFASNTALYLKEEQKLKKKNKIDFLYLAPTISNKQLEKMWKRKIRIYPKNLVRPFWLIFSFFKMRNHLAGVSRYKNRDINNLLYTTKNILDFTKEETAYCEKILKKIGINRDKIVLVICRDDNYLKKTFGEGFQYHNYRNVDIETYAQAVKFLLKKKYSVIRMGKHIKKKLKIKNNNYFELFNSKFHSDLLEIYLASICKFCITSSTGYDEVVKIFQRPILYTNVCPISDIQANSKSFIIIFQKYYCKIEKKFLTFSEIASKNLHEIYSNNDFKKKNIILRKNSSIEILKATEETIKYVEKKKEEKKYINMQVNFWRNFEKIIIRKSKICHHNLLNATISNYFLKKVKNLII